MASVFLSYDREDADKARALASALEKAGHSVWWDLHVRGGAQFSKEIERALKEADAVLVLWSERSVESPWVRDEAAAGRDSGRLVPVALDHSEPPLGFRQFQTIDLSRWKGRGKPEQLGTLLTDLDAIAATKSVGQAPSSLPPAPRPAKIDRSGVSAVTLITAAAILLGLIAAVAGWKLFRPQAEIPSVAIEASEPSAPSRSLARDLLVKLGSLQAANADALQLIEPESGAKPDLTFKVGAVGGARDPRANLSLIDSRAGELLWSREFVQPGGNEADLRQQLAYSAAQVLHCATEALSPQHRKLHQSTLKLYLNGCADLSNLVAEDPQAALPNFKKVTQQAPSFAGGWGKLLIAETMALRVKGLFEDQELRRDLRSHIAEARKVDPTMAEAYLAEGWLQQPRPIIGWLRFSDAAVAKHPLHAEALATHSLGLIHVGRMREAVSEARRAVQVEPLSPSARVALIDRYMDMGSIEVARSELRKAELLWPGASDILSTRFTLEYRYGDARQALQMLQSGQLGMSPSAAQHSFLKARIDPSDANVERAIADARLLFQQDPSSLSTYIQTLAQFGRNETLVNVLSKVDPRVDPGIIATFFRSTFANLHNDRRFIAIADRFKVVEYWRTSGKWPDFCSRPDLPYDCKAEAAKFTA